MVLRQAKGLDRTLRQMTLLVDEDDRLVGNFIGKVRGSLFVPEYGWDRPGFFYSRFDTVPHAGFTEEDEKEFRDLEAYWKDRTLVDEIARRRADEGLTQGVVPYRGEFQHLPDSHATTGHEFEDQPVPWILCPENDFIHDILFGSLDLGGLRWLE